MTPPPVALTIAGTDPSGGAGIQADLKTFSALGAFGTSVIAALVAQNTQGVQVVHQVPADFVETQLANLASDVRIDAVKIGMLGSSEVADVVAEFLATLPSETPVVLDPVLVATSGDSLAGEGVLDKMRGLLARADAVTPNIPEAAALSGLPEAASPETMAAQARRIRELGARGVLLKGGHLDGDTVSDLWLADSGEHWLTQDRIHTKNTHGTGCTLSSAIAALRPQRDDWLSAVTDAHAYVRDALAAADTLDVGKGHGPVHHFHRWWPAG
ncbi:bifunctional hydroxymethylpyrimidine kinase/phosphomethylpyrimidine kinase [Nigerium massiliense]|uniref:bifunctional hydroxymethylpyrimidine kinase/phosphomethylpyrimidine kinase n=1 Tax=Nigerium massiliense TaxID=1522317 RepID=UPI00058C71FF|nr:bifunctional hydroxymethylpyrimidine kinase/phosphomethylpyrimidine kinase [Nigerium massiliense]